MASPEMLAQADSAPETVTLTDGVKSKSPLQIAFDRLRKDVIAIICASVVVLFIVLALLAPAICKAVGVDPYTFHFELVGEDTFPTIGMTPEHPFGVEPGVGRDLLARWLYGARPSLLIAFSATVISTVFGTLIGITSALVGGWVDRIATWIIDFFLSLPLLLLVIALTPIIETHFSADSEVVAQVRLWTLIVIFGIFGWTGLARLIRAQVLSLREREFVLAARAIGVPTRRIILRELFPNVTGQIIVFMSLALPAFVSAEAGFSYLGIGLIPPMPSWGQTIQAATPYYQTFPVYFWLPALGILFLVLALNLLGDAIRDAFDPKTRR